MQPPKPAPMCNLSTFASHHSRSFMSTYCPQALRQSCAVGTSDVPLVQTRKLRRGYHEADGAAHLPHPLLSYSSLLPSTYNQLLRSSSFISSLIHALVHLFIHSLHSMTTFWFRVGKGEKMRSQLLRNSQPGGNPNPQGCQGPLRCPVEGEMEQGCV